MSIEIPKVTSYVAAFIFSHDLTEVALIRKAKPEWQKGLLNGIGGKVEPGEYSDQAIHREVKEEAGVAIEPESDVTARVANKLIYFARIGGRHKGGGFQVRFYAARWNLDELRTMEEEPIERVRVADIHPHRKDMIENLPWLIALAVDCLQDGRPVRADVVYL